MAYSVEKGVVGMVARKMQVIHVANISQNGNIDHFADGLQRAGRPVGASAAMLVGPLLADPESIPGGGDKELKLLGIVQLLERRRRTTHAQAADAGVGIGGGAPPTGEFTHQEQAHFSQLLRVFAYAARRTWKVQELSAQLDGAPHTLSRLLTGK